jgi:DNA invertase Pin-like site-specific DNA recombinase
MTASIAPTTGREYNRVSHDKSGRLRSVDEQHADNVRAAEHRRVILAQPYQELEAVSASRYTKHTRDEFDRMVSDIRAGRFGADELWLWEVSRGSRDVTEWDALLSACQRRGVHIFVTSHNRLYDPAVPRDRRSLLEEAVDSDYESGKISERVRRANAANAEAGRPHGKAPYGYARRYDPLTRKLAEQHPHPSEAPIVRELFERLESGDTLSGIARDFAARGIEKRSGGPFSQQHLRDMALMGTYAGLRLHDPLGHRAGRSHTRPGGTCQIVEGTWEGLISVETYWTVHKILTDPKRVTTRPGGARHLLSMIARCDVCGGVLTVNCTKVPDGQYRCPRGHVLLPRVEFEELAVTAILAYLSTEENLEPIMADRAKGNDRLAEINAELAAVGTQLADLEAALVEGKISPELAGRAETRLQARIEDLDRERRTADPDMPVGMALLMSPVEIDRAQVWAGLPIGAKREVARFLLAPEWMGELRVARKPPGSSRVRLPVADRIVWRRIDGQPAPSLSAAARRQVEKLVFDS